MPFSNMTVLSPQHMTIPANTVCHSQLLYGFIQTQHEHQICRSFSIFELYSTLLLQWISLFFVKFSSHFSSGTMLHQYRRPYITPINSLYQLRRKFPLTALPKLNPPTPCSGSHSSLTSYTCTHPVTKICEFPYSFHFTK